MADKALMAIYMAQNVEVTKIHFCFNSIPNIKLHVVSSRTKRIMIPGKHENIQQLRFL